DPFRAAIEGTREIGLAVLATTLSLLAVFIPVGFMTGIVGRFMSSFGLTSAAAIAVSLIVSFTLTPMLAARWIKRPESHETEEEFEGSSSEAALHAEEPEGVHTAGGDSKAGFFYRAIENTYRRLLKISLRFRWAVLLLCVIVVVSIYPLFRYVGMAFLPDEDE